MATSDPLNVNARLYKQLGKLLDDMESMDRDDTMTFPQRLNALIAVGRVQVIFANLRKADARDPIDAGSSVRKYSAAFEKPHAARGGKARARLAPVRDDAIPAFEPIGDGGDSDDGSAA